MSVCIYASCMHNCKNHLVKHCYLSLFGKMASSRKISIFAWIKLNLKFWFVIWDDDDDDKDNNNNSKNNNNNDNNNQQWQQLQRKETEGTLYYWDRLEY